MKTVTHYEVYQASSGQWGMVARYTGGERDIALSEARSIEEHGRRPAAVIEEAEELGSANFEIRLIHRTADIPADIRVPANESDLGTRMFMIALNALTIGAVAVVLAAVALARANLATGTFNIALLAIFGVLTVLSGLVLFRIYIPVGVILWRSKDPESRRRTMQALAHGRIAVPREPAPEPAPPPAAPAPSMFTFNADEPEPAPPPALAEPAEAVALPDEAAVATDDPTAPGQTAEPALESALPPPPPAAPSTPAPVQPAIDAATVERLRMLLLTFTDEQVGALARLRPQLSAADRLGFNLYLHGAAVGAAERHRLGSDFARALTTIMLERSRLPEPEISAFFADVEIAGERPRYRRMIDEGTLAISRLFGEATSEPRTPLGQLLEKWSESAGRGDPQQLTFLLTDMVGSTAMTSELGNAAVQRIVRAHNAIVRAAAKAFRGREVKHTGDGMLLIFPDSVSGARAAIDIQQEATTYARDNQAAPLNLRVAVHTGEAVFEDGEYFGPAVAIVNGLGPLVSVGEICCSATVRQKVPPSAFRFEDLGLRTIKGATTAFEVVKLLWEPKRVLTKSVLEYRQIGTTGVPVDTAAAEPERPGG